MLLLTLSLPTCRVCARAHPPAMLKPRQRHRKAFRPVTSCNVPLSQNHLMAKVTTVIFSLYLKVVLQLFSESRGSAFLLLALAYIYYSGAHDQLSEIDRADTQETWVAEAGCQQACDCSNEWDVKQGTACQCVCGEWKWWQRQAGGHTHAHYISRTFYESHNNGKHVSPTHRQTYRTILQANHHKFMIS